LWKLKGGLSSENDLSHLIDADELKDKEWNGFDTHVIYPVTDVYWISKVVDKQDFYN